MLSQVSAITGINIKSIPQRWASSLVIVIGLAGVVAVFTALLAMLTGFESTLKAAGRADEALIMRGSSDAEINSGLDRDSDDLIEQAPGIRRGADGKPLASAEVMVIAELIRKDDVKNGANITLRGVEPAAFALRPQLKIVEGRNFTPGLRELIAGKGATKQFAGLEPGHQIRLGSQLWTVVGVFASGDALDSEIWGDAGVVADTYRRGGSRASVTVRLSDPQTFDAFKAGLEANPQLKVDVDTTLDYFSKQSEGTTQTIRAIGITVGLIMAIGALFGALNTMFAAVASRAREIATLRAIGFRGLPVVVAILLETMLLALLGGLLGGLLAWLLFNGYSASTLAAGTVGKLSFELKVTAKLLWIGVLWALTIGFIGGLFPALRAARLPVTTALREL